MAKRISQKQITRELERISRNVPEELIKNLIKKEVIAPTIHEMVEKALAGEGGEITQEQRDRFQNMIAAGVLSREVEVINPDGEQAISAWYDAEIALAVKLGRLPKEAPMPSFIKKKGIKYARKRKANLEKLFAPEGDNAEGAEEQTPGDQGEDPGRDSAPGSDDALLPPQTGGSD